MKIDWGRLSKDWEGPGGYVYHANNYLRDTLPYLALQERLFRAGENNHLEDLLRDTQEISVATSKILTSVIDKRPAQVLKIA